MHYFPGCARAPAIWVSGIIVDTFFLENYAGTFITIIYENNRQVLKVYRSVYGLNGVYIGLRLMVMMKVLVMQHAIYRALHGLL